MRFLRNLLGLVAVVASAGVSLLAQAKDGFVPADSIANEGLPASPLLYTAYALVWLVLIGYILILWRRLGRVEKEIQDVTARIGSQKRS